MKTRVFISWSGEKSLAIAKILRDWLPPALPVDPFFSQDDVRKGNRWLLEVAKVLSDSKVGLLCVTSENLTAPWLAFEAGALGKDFEECTVCPILFGVKKEDLDTPLSQFQAAHFEKPEFKQVVETINERLGGVKLKSQDLETCFEKWWPDLERKVTEELRKPHTAEAAESRSDHEILVELLDLTRGMTRSPREVDAAPLHPALLRSLARKCHNLIDVVESMGGDYRLWARVQSLLETVGRVIDRPDLDKRTRQVFALGHIRVKAMTGDALKRLKAERAAQEDEVVD